MNTALLLESIRTTARYSFSRSGGPGGQNVNKVNSKATLFLDINQLAGITQEERAALMRRLHGRISGDGIFSVSSDVERSQIRNRDIVLSRAMRMIQTALIPQKKRVPTKPSKQSRLKRLATKAHHARIKSDRSRPDADN
jgi:ribosome-associated protein